MRSSALFAVVALFTASSSLAHEARVENGHLQLLSKRGEGALAVNAGHAASGMKKRSASHKKSKRGTGVCRPKSSSGSSGSSNSGSSSSSSSNSNTDATSSSSANNSQQTQSSGNGDSGSSSSNGGSSSNSGGASALGSISAFQSQNTGIVSWFRTNSGSDSTNGESWCQTKYQDDWLCFAPSVGTMLSNFGGDYNTAAKAYCGREAKVTTPDGKSVTAFICDGFDDKWVLSPGSIDATVGLFTALHGSFDNNKNTVIQGATWELTGGVATQGTFKNGKTY